MAINKLDYFKLAMRDGLYRHRAWLFRVLSLPNRDKAVGVNVPGFREGKWFYHNPEIEGGQEEITGWEEGQPLFPIKERFTITEDFLSCVREPVETNYGEAIINACIFEWGSEGVLPYVAGKINKKLLSKRVSAALLDQSLSVPQYLKVMQAMNYITVFAEITVSAYTPKALTASPEALKIRDELLEKFKDQLDDPAIVAMIDEAITEADREYMAGDDASKFFLKDKAYAVVRKKLFHVQGGLAKLDDPSKMDYIPRSLGEGYAAEDLPAIINSLRSGSYDRGASTALGGEAAKFSNRVFQNLKIAEDDCRTMVGKPELVEAGRDLVGRYIVGRDEPISEQEFAKLIGTEIILRDPTACKTKNRGYCARCMGDKEVNSNVGLGPRMAEMCNVFMSISLAAFHGTASKTVDFDPVLDIV
ncbi:hypothetical protein [Vibrio phage vB_VmeM-Yong XC32]|nr:hypothetical protein [Vibrio phage vB_VmeM-Yong XC31]QAX96342.1 hypothetical protein [Vibrio phage vB_VmeM-Yong XC32]QAX96660.1 hypothetical protein [Vibrio phage vB_VmeM-Yong MS31]QAX96978.1 hypothetical protein [Vibrio phage vB_VmeM-Yong MS32]